VSAVGRRCGDGVIAERRGDQRHRDSLPSRSDLPSPRRAAPRRAAPDRATLRRLGQMRGVADTCDGSRLSSSGLHAHGRLRTQPDVRAGGHMAQFRLGDRASSTPRRTSGQFRADGAVQRAVPHRSIVPPWLRCSARIGLSGSASQLQPGRCLSCSAPWLPRGATARRPKPDRGSRTPSPTAGPRFFDAFPESPPTAELMGAGIELTAVVYRGIWPGAVLSRSGSAPRETTLPGTVDVCVATTGAPKVSGSSYAVYGDVPLERSVILIR